MKTSKTVRQYRTKQLVKRLIFSGVLIWLYGVLGLFGVIQIGLMMAMMIGQFALIFYFMSRYGTYEIVQPGEINVSWDDVYGQDKVVKRMRQMQIYLEEPEKIENVGGFVPKGVILWGPPGVGKTLMAKAFASSTKFPFVLVPPGGFAAMFIGVNFMKVARLFRVLRKLADQHGGVICFMDEIDNLGSRGGQVTENDRSVRRSIWNVVVGGMSGGNMGTLPMLLSKMDGLDKPSGLGFRIRKMLGMKQPPPPKRRILFFGATNMLQNLDPALLRDGRFDRKLYVGYPTLEGRVQTFDGYLRKIAHNISSEQVMQMAKDNPRASGAFIRGIINEGLINAVEDGRAALEWKDMRDAIIFKSMGEDQGRQRHEGDQRRVAIHEAAHAVAAYHFRKDEKIAVASVVMRGHTLGFVQGIPLEERHTQTKSEMEADIKVSLASHWAEGFWFGDISSGPASDLENANILASKIQGEWALGDNLAILLDKEEGALAEYSFDKRDEYLHKLYKEMADFLAPRKDQVEAVADLLNKKDTVDGEEIIALLERLEQ